MIRPNPPSGCRLCLAFAMAIAVLSASDSAIAQEGSGVYRLQVNVIVDAPHGRREYLKRRIAEELRARIQAALGGRSEVRVEFTREFPLLAAAAEVGIQPATPAAERAAALDKVLHLRVRETFRTFEIFAQDYDVGTRYLCPPVHGEVRQPTHVLERSIDVLMTALSPAAEFQQIADDPDHVLVSERLRPAEGDDNFAAELREGDVLIPVLRRDAAEGESDLPETQVIPWTVLVVETREEDHVRCRVESSSRRPLGVRRRGRIDQLAVAVRPSPAPVTLRLRTQSEPRRPLPGCRVFLRGEGDAEATVPLGVSDQSGSIVVPTTGQPVQTVWIKSGEMLIAKLPIVPGMHDSLDVPLAEDPARIRAEADLGAVRTELVDLVARRNILLARARAAVEAGDLELARRLADELDSLPTRAQFNRRIDSVAQSATSQDRRAQQRIDKLVEETRSVLGQYLDPREVGELRSAIIEAG